MKTPFKMCQCTAHSNFSFCPFCFSDNVLFLPAQVCVALLDLLWWASKSPAIILYPKTLPCNVNETDNGSAVMVDCTAKGLVGIPQGIPRDTTNLTLTINHIPKLNSTSFGGLENLTELDMRCNCLPIKIGPKDHICSESLTIEDNTFESLTKLRALYLDGNQLSSIPKGLPPDLLLLSLEVNHIYDLSHANLSAIKNVETLYLGQNCYYRNPCNSSYQIEAGAFLQLNNLTLLSLKSNNLSFIPHQLPTGLKELYLYNNNIEEVTENDFKNLTNLEILDISGNCPRCYNAPFPCTPCRNNSALQISKSAFRTLAKLKTLRMHSNSLKTVLPEWFSSAKELRVLDLSSNYLAKDIGFADFPRFLSKMEDLDLSFNYELQRYPQTLKFSKHFSKLKSLKILRIKGYVFQQLKQESIDPLKPLRKLEVIDLGTNFIKITNLSILMDLPNFNIISLSENKISAPSDEQDAVGFSGEEGGPLRWSPMLDNFKNKAVREIQYFRYDEYARSCKHKDKELGIEMSFAKKECTNFGKTLDVSRNNIFFLHSRFLNLSELRCLNLSGNAMSQSLNGSEFTYLTNLKYLDFTLNRLDLRYATAFQELQNLVILDISKNNHYFEFEGITRMLNFTKSLKKLKTLRMNHNKIWTSTNTEMESESLERLEFIDNRLDLLWRDGDTRFVKYFKKLLNLRELDISHNNLNFIPHQVFSSLPEKLSVLYIKNNKLKSFAWEKLHLLQALQVLDLSGNSLSTVPSMLSNCTKTLKRLVLKGNQIHTLTPDFLKDARNFTYLDISFNHIRHVEKSSFPDDVVGQMEMLLLHNNDFVCSCNVTSFVTWLNSTTVPIPKLATDVTCATPEAKRGQLVISVDLLACQHNDLSILLYMLNTSLILSFLILSISSHLFLWDVWYIYHFCLAKLKGYGRLDSQSALYDAFVIYDKADPAVLEWVTKEMCIHLEQKGDRRLVLCLEERDWIPGCPLIDNLSQSIHKSKRTVFVLTNKYIKSGNFKTAFYMAQQRLMDEKNDVIILILLEDVPCNSKYLRLRKRLYKRSVLKWPTNPQAQPYFWFSLRSVLATESHKQYNNLFKETL
nr:toll like receptor 7 [Oostethus manadensis]